MASRILDWEGRHIDYNGSSLHYLGYGLQEDLGLPVEEAPRRDRVLFPCGGAMLVDRKVFLELGGFDPDFFALFEDVDLGWRLWLAGHRVVLAPGSVVRHRDHATLETQAPEKTRYLIHRNALLTIFKNYEEEHFRKIVPLAFLLSVKRAVHFSGVRKESFYLWSETRHKLEEGDETARSQLLDSLNHLVAVDDVLQSLPRLLEKRRRVQALRRRSDREIMELFGDPLRRIVEDPAYVKEELELLESLELDSLLDLAPSAASLESLPGSLGEKIRNLEKELNALRWLGSHAALHPPDPPGLATRFLRHRPARGVEGRLPTGVRLRQPGGVKDDGGGDFLVADQGGLGGDGVPTLHLLPTESHSGDEEQAARKPPFPVGDKKVAPPSGRQESRPS